MVRKRAPAQKALSPEKAFKKKRKGNEENGQNSISSMDNNNLEVITSGNEDSSHGDLMIYGTEEDREVPVEDACYDELPDFNSFSKKLTDKTYWEAVKVDYTDFTNWTCLLQTFTDTEDNLEAARSAYNCFLRYYPYCFGYWKKFSDLEKKQGDLDKAREVFSRGVKAIHVSIDLWVHYLNFTIQQNQGKENSQDIIRKLFNEAINAAGMEFKSNKLWNAYIEWEKSLGNLKRVTEIYDKLISTPTQQYLKNWERFKQHLESHPLSEVLPTEEYVQLMQRIDAIPPGMTTNEEPSIITNEDEGKTDDSETKEVKNDNEKETDKIKERVIAERESIFVETAGEIKKRWKYEEAIKRPYFHVKPLEKSQISNWKEYLDYEIRQGGHKRICFLFERCVVACALYEEFWEKYIEYIEPRDQNAARKVFLRACNIHQIKKYKINLAWATFEEHNKNYTQAADILSSIDKNFPGMIMITMRRVGLARRMNRPNDIVRIYENAIEKSERIEDKIFYSIKYSHVLAKTVDNKTKARDVLWKALTLGKKHKRLYLQLLELEIHYGEVDNDHSFKLFNAVENDMSLSEDFRDSFAQRKVEFYEEYGDDIEKILQVKESYEHDRKRRRATKRTLSNSSTDSAIKLPKTEAEVNQTPPNVNTVESGSWYNSTAQSENQYNDWRNYAAQYANYNQQQRN